MRYICMTEHLPARGDALEIELGRQPESDARGRALLERAETGDDRHDAACAEFSFMPEQQEISDSPASRLAPRHEHDDEKGLAQWPSSPREQTLDMIAHWSWITLFSILGTLTRLGLQFLNTYPGSLIPPLVWAQFVGCAVMGFVTQDNSLFPKKMYKNDAFYLGITVGYCGSVTSFSAWILQVFEDLANTQDSARPRGYNIISIITQVMVTLAASIAAFRLGNHMAILTNTSMRLPRVPKLTSPFWIMALLVLAISAQAGTIVAAGLRRDWRGIAVFALVFSPAGALTRWYLSRTMNRLVPAFPMGTFAANMIGSLLESIFHLLQYRSPNGNSCSILQGLQDGYCGALSTVSTFVVELCTLQKNHAYIYAITSIVTGTILYVLVDGVDYWTHGSASGYYLICTF